MLIPSAVNSDAMPTQNAGLFANRFRVSIVTAVLCAQIKKAHRSQDCNYVRQTTGGAVYGAATNAHRYKRSSANKKAQRVRPGFRDKNTSLP